MDFGQQSDLLRFNFEFKEWDIETFGTYPVEGFWRMDVILGKKNFMSFIL